MRTNNYEYKDLMINDIIVYEDNPRNIKAINQIDEINKMIESHSDKGELARLAESLLSDGQSPLDNIGVVYSEENQKFRLFSVFVVKPLLV